MTTLLVASFHNRPQLLHFDPENATLTLETLKTPEFQDYTWISAHPSHKGLLYALQRYSDAPGKLSIVRLTSSNEPTSSSNSTSSPSSPSPPRLEILKSYPSHGMDPCHLGISPEGDKLAIANVNTSLSYLRIARGNVSESAENERLKIQYDSSTVTIYTLNQDGMVNEDIKPEIHDISKQEEFKTGPNEERQEAAHPHGCFFVPSLNCFLVPDLGADKLRLIGTERTLSCEAGAGPRHAVINSKTNIAYVVNELNNTITTHELSSSGPSIASYSVLPSDVKPESAAGMCASAINIPPDNRFIYVTNRLECNSKGDAVVWFKVSTDGRSLQRAGELRTGLDHPRAAEIFECKGKLHYIVGSKTEKGAVVYSIDTESGELKEIARNQDVLSPSGFVAV